MSVSHSSGYLAHTPEKTQGSVEILVDNACSKDTGEVVQHANVVFILSKHPCEQTLARSLSLSKRLCD